MLFRGINFGRKKKKKKVGHYISMIHFGLAASFRISLSLLGLPIPIDAQTETYKLGICIWVEYEMWIHI